MATMATPIQPLKAALRRHICRRQGLILACAAEPARGRLPRRQQQQVRRVGHHANTILGCHHSSVGRLGAPLGGSGNARGAPTRGTMSLLGTSLLQIRHSSSSSSRAGATTQRPPLPVPFLEAHDERRFDPATHQRNDVPFDPVDGKPPHKHISWSRGPKSDTWSLSRDPESHFSQYSNGWVNSQLQRWRADPADFDSPWSANGAGGETKTDATKRVLWSNWTEGMVRDPNASPILFQYDNLIGNGDAPSADEARMMKALHQYGLVLITGTPTQTDSLPREVMSDATKSAHATTSDTDQSAEAAILNLAQMIGYYPLRTLYGGGVWSTSSHYDVPGEESSTAAGGSASTADSAYGSTSLPLHTDMTYLTNPPGVQVFLMVQPATASRPSQTDANGDATIRPKGQSVYLDGISAARQLLLENPEAFRLLATTPRRFRCVDDDEGWHLEATGPVIETVPGGIDEWGPVKSIRHNDLDRLPDLPPYSARGAAESDSFYQQLKKAHEAWDDILRRDSMRLVIDMQPGDCVLVSNQRCMHARYAFETSAFPRVVMGCYVGMDELSSKWRASGINVR